MSKLGVFAAVLAACCGVVAADFDDAICSPAYFWMWNDRLDVQELCRQLDDMRAHGLRNVCIHPVPKRFRPDFFHTDMEPDYLTPEYLRVFAEVTRHAAKLGMHSYLYDEGGWPSGGACGLVAKEDPSGRLAQRWLALGGDGNVRVNAGRYDFNGPAPYPSIVEKGTTEKFLALTHARYAAALGDELGSSVRIAFTDEPNAPSGWGWTSDFADEFRRRKGYDLEPHLPELLRRKAYSAERVAELTIDYRDVMADLVVERFLAPVRDWCRAHRVLSGGHMNGENDPSLVAHYGHGSILRSLRAMDAPGVDVIWRQAFPPDGDRPAVAPPFPRYAASAAHQNGGRFALSETFGIFGDSVSPAQMKWLVDYQLVRGINTFVFGYLAQTNRGHWMTLFEPHSGPVTPYWDFQRPFFEYVERLCRELSRGRSAADAVVLYDVRGLWAGGDWTKEAASAHRTVADALDRRQVDYDFAEDRDLAAASVGTDGTLSVGAAKYRTVVLPTFRWIDEKAAAKLAAFERAGGTVVRGTDVSAVRRTLDVSGAGAADLRVMRRTDDARTLYFTHNEAMTSCVVKVTFPSAARVVRFDPSRDLWETVAEGGVVEATYGPGETALYAEGEVGKSRMRRDQGSGIGDQGSGIRLEGPWTIRPVVAHEAGKDDIVIRSCTDDPKPVTLGDWRPSLGERFSGRAAYRTTFVAEKAGAVQLDLGMVKYAARVRLNGQDLGPRFFGPYRWDAQTVAGTNVVEVEVANLLVNQLGPDDVRDRIARDYPPKGRYDQYQRPFDRQNHESGLYGPVTVRACER